MQSCASPDAGARRLGRHGDDHGQGVQLFGGSRGACRRRCSERPQPRCSTIAGTGMSVMEMSHRSAAFAGIIEAAEADLRDLVGIPDNYQRAVPAGRRDAAVRRRPHEPHAEPRGRLRRHGLVGEEGLQGSSSCYGDARCRRLQRGRQTFSYIPDVAPSLPVSVRTPTTFTSARTTTIYGTKFHTLPNTKGKDLVADVSSCFLSEPVDITKYGVMYGGAQKNIGPAGVVIVHRPRRPRPATTWLPNARPPSCSWKTQADAELACTNTPPALRHLHLRQGLQVVEGPRRASKP